MSEVSMAAKHAGRGTRRFKTLAREVRAKRRPCCRCGQPIDYDLPAEHPDSFTVEHKRPLSTHPELAEDPGNLDAAHRRCNSSRGNSPAAPGLGVTSRDW
jgi:5-methylcytosine-specific restriction endonuclease McrA